MLYLIWGLLNIGLFIFLIVICFRATKLIREKLGLFAAMVFVFGLLSFVTSSNKGTDSQEPDANQIKTWKFISEDSLKSNDTRGINVQLEKTWVSKYNLGIEYGTEKSGQSNIPISAYSSTTGLVSGTQWKPESIMVGRTNDNNKFEYFVSGTVDWNLLGTTIYTQLKTYKGYASTR